MDGCFIPFHESFAHLLDLLLSQYGQGTGFGTAEKAESTRSACFLVEKMDIFISHGVELARHRKAAFGTDGNANGASFAFIVTYSDMIHAGPPVDSVPCWFVNDTHRNRSVFQSLCVQYTTEMTTFVTNITVRSQALIELILI
jgi:hypothetical protein